MAEVVASVSTGVMQSLLCKLAKLLGDEYNLLQGVRGDVEFLHRELSGMDAMLRRLVAMEKHGRDTKGWRIKLKEMAYDIEDGIDVFIDRLGSANDKDGFMRDVAKQLNIKVRHEIAKRIQELKSRVLEEGDRRNRYNLDSPAHTNVADKNTSESATDHLRVKALYADADHQLVGMDGPVEKIVELLTLEEDCKAHQLQIVSILGPGGLGKTTLASQVHRKIQGQFDYTALVSVSQRADLANLEEILMKLAPVSTTNGGTLNRWQLIDNAKRYLRDKRYLIVFDDIWRPEIWEELKSALPENKKKSRVITTTRIYNVAMSCRSKSNDHIYEMDPLSDTHSKELFIRRSFGPKRGCPEALGEIANKILKKCGGIPLAILTIASLLAKKPKTKKEWKRVQTSLGNASELQGMNKTLSLSFNDLSYDLRTCFLYLAIFPEDCEIDRERLIFRWIAEGFISGKEGNVQELEKTGEDYFNELINRSLIQPIDIQYNGLARACRVHDLMLNLIVSLSKEENFVMVLDSPDCPSILSKIRWLSMHSNEYALKVIADNRWHVRSLSFFPPAVQLPSLLDCRALRILDVKGCHFLEPHKLKHFESLIQLKYLDLSDTNVTELPKQIGYLQYLETLDLRNSSIKILPSTLSQLHKLIRLFVSPGVILPVKIGKMQALEQVSHVGMLCNSLKFVENLRHLFNLRLLKIDCKHSWVEGKKQGPVANVSKYNDTLLMSLRTLLRKNLQTLEIDLADDSMVFSLLDSCHGFRQLEELVISNFICRVPKGLRLLEDLTYLDMKLTKMEVEDLHILNAMSGSLLFLRLQLGRSPDERLIIDSKGFLCLKQFEFFCEDGGMGLKFAPGAMPDLENLDLDIGVRTTMSKYGGFDFGIKNLESLKHLSVKLDCRSTESREIQAAETAIRSGVLARRLMPQIQIIGQ